MNPLEELHRTIQACLPEHFKYMGSHTLPGMNGPAITYHYMKVPGLEKPIQREDLSQLVRLAWNAELKRAKIKG